MRPDDPAEVPLEPVAPRPAVAEQPAETLPRRRSHLVVVVTRALDASEAGDSGAVLRARHWNPHERRWNENDYDGVESLRRRHIEEEGWELLQEQRLDAPLAPDPRDRGDRAPGTGSHQPILPLREGIPDSRPTTTSATAVERSTGFVQLLRLPTGCTADVVAEAMTVLS